MYVLYFVHTIIKESEGAATVLYYYVTHEYILPLTRFTAHCWHCEHELASEKSKILCVFLIKFVYLLLLPPFIILLHHTFFPHSRKESFSFFSYTRYLHACSKHSLMWVFLLFLDAKCEMRRRAIESLMERKILFLSNLNVFIDFSRE